MEIIAYTSLKRHLFNFNISLKTCDVVLAIGSVKTVAIPIFLNNNIFLSKKKLYLKYNVMIIPKHSDLMIFSIFLVMLTLYALGSMLFWWANMCHYIDVTTMALYAKAGYDNFSRSVSLSSLILSYIKKTGKTACLSLLTSLKLRVRNKIYVFSFLHQTYVVGTQKNRLDGTVLLSAQNIC